MSSDNQYTALGPAIVGFQTSATRIDVGADIEGNAAGIIGRSDGGAGVTGSSSRLQGVSGRSEKGTGVLGVGQDTIGVVGRGRRGVVGYTGGLSNFGGDDPTYSEPVIIDKDTPQFIGVLGFSGDGPGVFGFGEGEGDQGTGVEGSSPRGTGIHGHSVLGRGGVFQTGRQNSARPVPQIQLVPNRMSTSDTVPASPSMFDPGQMGATLPSRGKAGDLLTTIDPATKTASLWLCVQGEPDSPDAIWAEILLGKPINGRA